MTSRIFITPVLSGLFALSVLPFGAFADEIGPKGKGEPGKKEVVQQPLKQEPIKQEPIGQARLKQQPIVQAPVKQQPIVQAPVRQPAIQAPPRMQPERGNPKALPEAKSEHGQIPSTVVVRVKLDEAGNEVGADVFLLNQEIRVVDEASARLANEQAERLQPIVLDQDQPTETASTATSAEAEWYPRWSFRGGYGGGRFGGVYGHGYRGYYGYGGYNRAYYPSYGYSYGGYGYPYYNYGYRYNAWPNRYYYYYNPWRGGYRGGRRW